jgi:hypothetical protein
MGHFRLILPVSRAVRCLLFPESDQLLRGNKSRDGPPAAHILTRQQEASIFAVS